MTVGTEPAATPAPSTTIPLRSWQWGLGPQLIGLFLLITAYDRLGPQTLARAGLIPSILGALAGGVLALLLLFWPAAYWGVRTRGTPMDLATSAFGSAGARSLAAVVFGLAQTIWFATALGYSASLTLESFVSLGLLESRVLEGLDPTATAPAWAGPEYLTVTILWMVSALALSKLLWPIVAAVLYAYQPFPALAMGAVMVWALGGIAANGWPGPLSGQISDGVRMMIQMVFAYAASAGILAVDWGAGSQKRRDVTLGGIVGLGLAPGVIISVVFVTILGGLSRLGATITSPEAFVYHNVLREALPLSGVVLLIFTLALLGPVCYTAVLACRAFAMAWPFLPRWVPPIVVASLAWPLAATGLALRLELMFGLAGGPVAALLGVIAAWLLVSRSRDEEPAPLFRPIGLIAWLAGAVVGVLPYLGPMAMSWLQPSAVAAWAVAFLLAGLGWGIRSLGSPNSKTTRSETISPRQGDPESA